MREYKLIKSLYGFKQEHKKWHQRFDEVAFKLTSMICVYVEN